MQPVHPSDNTSSSHADDNDVEMTSYSVRSNSRSAHDNARIQDEDDGMPELLDVSDSDLSSESDGDQGEVEMLSLDDSTTESLRDLGADNDDDMLPLIEMHPPLSSTPIIGTPSITPFTPQRNSARRVRDDEDEDRDRRHPHHRVGRPPAAVNESQWHVHLNQAPSASGMPATINAAGAPVQNYSQLPQGTRPQRPANTPVVGNFSITFDLSTGVPVIVSGGRPSSNATAPGPTMPTTTNADNNRLPRATTASNGNFSEQSGGLADADNHGSRAAGTDSANNSNGGGNADNNNGDSDPPSPDRPSGPTIFDMLARLGFLTMLGLNPMEREQDDPERAQKLVDGLEEVPVGLVKRMERVGGGGDDGTGDSICAVCWDKLIDEDAESGDIEQQWKKVEGSAAEREEADRQINDTILPSSMNNSSSSLSNSESSTSALSSEESATSVSSSSSTASTSTSSSDKPQTQTQTQTEPESRKKYPKVISLPCAHVFHAACLIPWFSRPRQTTCPTCRFNVDPEELTRRRPGLGARTGSAGLGGAGGIPGRGGIFGFGFAPGMGPGVRMGAARPADEGANANAADTSATGLGGQEPGQGHGPGPGQGQGQEQGQGQGRRGRGRQPFMMGMGNLDGDVIGIGGISVGGLNDVPMFRFGPFGMDGGNGADNPVDGAQPAPAPEAGVGTEDGLMGEGNDAATRDRERLESFLQAMFGAARPPPAGGANGADNRNQSQAQAGQEQPSTTPANALGTSPRGEQVPPSSQAGSGPGPVLGVNVNIPAPGTLPGMNANTTNGNSTAENRSRAPSRANSFGYLTLGFDVLVTGPPGSGDPLGAGAGAGPGPGLGLGVGDPDVAMEDSFRLLDELFNARPPSRQQGRGSTQSTPAPAPATSFTVPTPPPPPPPPPRPPPQPQPQPQTQEQEQGQGQGQTRQGGSGRGRFGPFNFGPGIHVRSGVGRSIGEALGQLFANLTGSPPPSRGDTPSTPAPQQQQQQQASPPLPPSFSRMRTTSQSRSRAAGSPPLPPSMFASMQAGGSGQSDSAGPLSQNTPVQGDDNASQSQQQQPQGSNPTQTTLPPFSEILESVQDARMFPTASNTGTGAGRGGRAGRFSMGTSSVGLGNLGGGLTGAFGNAPIIFGLGGPSRGSGTPQPTNRSAATGAQGSSANLGTAEGPLPPPPSDNATAANANAGAQTLPDGMSAGFDQLLASLFMPPGAGRTTGGSRGPTGGRRRPATAPDRERAREREREREEREKKEWTPPPAPGLSLRQRVEKREREAGLRCYDMSCGIGPSDEDPLVEITGNEMKQLGIRSPNEASGEVMCAHTFHPACLVSAQRVLLRGTEPCVVGDEVEVSCSVCRSLGSVSRGEWEQGVCAL